MEESLKRSNTAHTMRPTFEARITEFGSNGNEPSLLHCGKKQKSKKKKGKKLK